MNLDCEDPTLRSWLAHLERLRQATCTVLGIRCDKRFVLKDSCQQWTPLAIVATAGVCFIVVLCFSVIAATSVADSLLRWVVQGCKTHAWTCTPPACPPGQDWNFPSVYLCAHGTWINTVPGAGGGSVSAAAALQTLSGPPQRRARSCAGRHPSATRPRPTPGTSCAGRARRRRSSARPCCAPSASPASIQRSRWGRVLALHASCGMSNCWIANMLDCHQGRLKQ